MSSFCIIPCVGGADEGRDIPLEEFQKTITVNLTASFLLVKSCVEHMKSKKWGRIIFVSSISAKGVGINGCRMSLPIPFPTQPVSLFPNLT